VRARLALHALPLHGAVGAGRALHAEPRHLAVLALPARAALGFFDKRKVSVVYGQTVLGFGKCNTYLWGTHGNTACTESVKAERVSFSGHVRNLYE
jgi:hypothetical protein